MPLAIRRAFGCVGGIILALAVLMYLAPNLFIGIWPWTLTPLTARVVAGWFIMPGMMFLFMASDQRWSSWRLPLQTAILAFVLILLGVVRGWGDFKLGYPVTWIYLASLVGLVVALPALYITMERRRTIAS